MSSKTVDSEDRFESARHALCVVLARLPADVRDDLLTHLRDQLAITQAVGELMESRAAPLMIPFWCALIDLVQAYEGPTVLPGHCPRCNAMMDNVGGELVCATCRRPPIVIQRDEL